MPSSTKTSRTFLEENRRSVPAKIGSKSLTKRSFADQCDINAIMARYQATGQLPPGKTQEALYGDFSNVEDYLDSMERVRRAQAHFDALPAGVRDHCRNDPAVLLAMMDDPEAQEELRELGLLPPLETPLDPPASPVPPADPPPADPEGNTPNGADPAG